MLWGITVWHCTGDGESSRHYCRSLTPLRTYAPSPRSEAVQGSVSPIFRTIPRIKRKNRGIKNKFFGSGLFSRDYRQTDGFIRRCPAPLGPFGWPISFTIILPWVHLNRDVIGRTGHRRQRGFFTSEKSGIFPDHSPAGSPVLLQHGKETDPLYERVCFGRFWGRNTPQTGKITVI